MLADVTPSALVAVSVNVPVPVIVRLGNVSTPPEFVGVPAATVPGPPETGLSVNVTGPVNDAIVPPLPSTALTPTAGVTATPATTALGGGGENWTPHAPVTVVDGLEPDSEKPPATVEAQLPLDALQATLICSVTPSDPPGETAGVMLDIVTDPAGVVETVPVLPPRRLAVVIVKPVGAVRVTELNDFELAVGLLNVAVSVGVAPAGTDAGDILSV